MHKSSHLEVLFCSVLPIYLILKLKQLQFLFVITWHPRLDTFKDISWFLFGSSDAYL